MDCVDTTRTCWRKVCGMIDDDVSYVALPARKCRIPSNGTCFTVPNHHKSAMSEPGR